MSYKNKKKKFQKKPAKYGGTLSKAQKYQVKKLIHENIEDKYTDDLYPYTNQSYNGQLAVPRILTNGVAPGTGQSQRIGDRINLKSIDLRMSIYHNTNSGTDPQNSYRIIIFKWKLNTSVSIPSLGGILEYQPGLTTLNYGCDSPYMWVNKMNDDFAILYDKKFSLSPSSPTRNHHIRLNKYLGAVNYTAGGTTASGHIYILVCNDDGFGVTPCPTIGYICRTLYEDA